MPKRFSQTLALSGFLWLSYSVLIALEEWSDMSFSLGPRLLFFSGAFAIACSIIWHIEVRSNAKITSIEPPPTSAQNLSIGSLILDQPTLSLEHKISTNEWSAVMYFGLKNSTSQLLVFEATLEGNVNGIEPPQKRLIVSGIISSNETKRIIYSKIYKFSLNQSNTISDQVLVGTLKYDVKYRLHEVGEFVRSTGKTLQFQLFAVPESLPAGSAAKFETVVHYLTETEE